MSAGEVVPATPAEHVARVKQSAERLAADLVAASDAGVSHALILPQLVLVFREAFGDIPAGVLPQLGGMLGGGR